MSKTIGKKLKLLRMAAGYSQKELAEKIECDASYISALETGERGAGIMHISRFCQTLGLDKTQKSELLDSFYEKS